VRRLLLAAGSLLLAAVLLLANATRHQEPTPAKRVDGTRALVFFNSYCLGCRDQAPQVAAWIDRHRDLPVLGISYMEEREPAEQFAREVSWSFDVAGDPQGKLGRRYGVKRLDTIIVERRGRILTRYVPKPADS
jgi:peroxiredoxin